MRRRLPFPPSGIRRGPPTVSARAGPVPLAETPEPLANFAGRHRGETIVVCGCGPSLNDLPVRPGCITIGVNDVGRRFDPDYLVVVNPPAQFPPERRRPIEESRARAVFTQYSDWRLEHARRVPIALGAYGGVDFSNQNVLHYARNSPYVALCLAIHLGATRIGLIGVDFTDNHFFGATGAHPLAGSLPQIDAEYCRLRDACTARGIEVANLSSVSRLTAFPRMQLAKFLEAGSKARAADESLRAISRSGTLVGGAPAAAEDAPDANAGREANRRVFFVHHRFITCGDVLTDGLRHAAEELALQSGHAYWDDPQLPERVSCLAPDLLWVVNGRMLVKRWGARFREYRSAVWLVDEPYEVDDTANYSHHFSSVFINDPATLTRHRNSYYLPLCYDPRVHFSGSGARQYRVGFVGAANPTRERFLVGLAERGHLSYVVGGPWSDSRLRALCLAPNIPAARTAELYRDTDIVVNVFRDRHHFNHECVAATSMNPRIYEALACGALVVSEARPEIAQRAPELPTFAAVDEAAKTIERLLANPAERERLRRACLERLRDDTYSHRLRTALWTIFGSEAVAAEGAAVVLARSPAPSCGVRAVSHPDPESLALAFDDVWDAYGAIVSRDANGDILVEPGARAGPGAERGLASRKRFDAVELAFEVQIGTGACFLAKICQQDRLDQTTNSYHLLCDERRAYIAKHQHVFRHIRLARDAWQRVRLIFVDGAISLHLGDQLIHRVSDPTLTGGYAFLGAQGGPVQLRNVKLTAPGAVAIAVPQPSDVAVLQEVGATRIRVSIVTTVYDRTPCLLRCVESVRRLTFPDYEHIIVSDCPPLDVVGRIRAIAAEPRDERIGYINLARRHDNWGIAPAAAGLRRARGEYLCFLSDDNGYTPDHIDNLVRVLDQEPDLGFAYSSCLYDGRRELRHPTPKPACIDLGQPLFRRELFQLHFGDDLPFDMMAWDWHLIATLMARGVRWKHVDKASFVFRLAKYPYLIAGPQPADA